MTQESCKPKSWAWWAVLVVLAVLVLYPLSIGPVAWLSLKCDVPQWLDVATDHFYAPANWLMDSGPQALSDWYFRYWVWWVKLA